MVGNETKWSIEGRGTKYNGRSRKEGEGLNTKRDRVKGREPWSPIPLLHLFEERMPRTTLEMATPILIQAKARATVLFGNVKRFSQSEVVL